MFSYDVVAYEGQPFAQAHPDRLAVLGRLHGMTPAPPASCRMLDLGCGDGGHLLPIALAFPGAQLTGVDLSAVAVEQANARAAALGLSNVCFLKADILDLTPEFGEFDYITAHGVYAWVPDGVRDKLMSIACRNLAPHGVAYISYNAYPGGRLREMVRDMLLYQTHDIEEPELKLKHTYALLNLLSGSKHAVLKNEVEHLLERSPWMLFHDDLAEHFRPVFFSDFVAHAARHGLQFLAEAQFHVQQLFSLPQDVAETIRIAAAGDIIAEQQYLDFLEVRRFRSTLLCHGSIALERPPQPEAVHDLWVSTGAERVADDEFRAGKGAAVKTDAPHILAVMGYLTDRRHLAVEFRELVRAADAGDAPVAEFLLGAYAAGLVDLHTGPSCFTLDPGHRPRANALARLQAAEGARLVTSLRQASIEIGDDRARRLIALMDGGRDRDAIARELDVERRELDEKIAALAHLTLLEA
ncbi:MAG TPA: class I SAM-dependent methyltransferase [Bryobacteraceae bacterium]|nr:class I SAM-dependent methyltransferase [Bryobacteraceae bacterium]